MGPNALNSFLSGALLAGIDLGILAWATHGLGASPSKGRQALMGLAVLLKFAVLAGGFALLVRQGWFDKHWGAGGALAPFALFLLYQLLILQRRAAAKVRP